jgi:diaminopimelate decarboxylase
VLVKGDQFAVVRPRPTYDDMLAREAGAPWLQVGVDATAQD